MENPTKREFLDGYRCAKADIEYEGTEYARVRLSRLSIRTNYYFLSGYASALRFYERKLGGDL